MYAPVAKSAGFVSRTRLTLKTSLEPALRKFRRYSSRGTAGLRFGLVGTIMYAPCAESAPFASDGRLSSKTSLYPHILPPLLERGGVEQSETEGIRHLEAEQTIPQSAIWLTAPFARGSHDWGTTCAAVLCTREPWCGRVRLPVLCTRGGLGLCTREACGGGCGSVSLRGEAKRAKKEKNLCFRDIWTYC